MKSHVYSLAFILRSVFYGSYVLFRLYEIRVLFEQYVCSLFSG